MDEMIQAIKDRLSEENRGVTELYAELKQLGMTMYFTNRITKEMVILMCSDLLRTYFLAKPK